MLTVVKGPSSLSVIATDWMMVSSTTCQQFRTIFHVGGVHVITVVILVHTVVPMASFVAALSVAMHVTVSMEKHYAEDVEAKAHDADI